MNTRNGRQALHERQTEAAERQAERDSRSNKQQLHKLINAGHGHCREAQRLTDGIGDVIQDKDEWMKSRSFRGE